MHTACEKVAQKLHGYIIIIIIMNVTGGTDYVSGPYNATFSAGRTTALFNVAIITDTVLESNEEVILTIDPSLLPSNVIAGSSDHSTITIVDDEEGKCHLECIMYSSYDTVLVKVDTCMYCTHVFTVF